jgi:glutathione synthase/RimK-type ligase-like ATP-grasp enzyme
MVNIMSSKKKPIGIFKKLMLHSKKKNLVPNRLKKNIQKYLDVGNLRKASWISQDPYANNPPVSSYKSKYPYIFGIIKEFWHMHWHYIAACRDLGVAYKVLDISGPDWQDIIKKSNCDAYLVRPSVQFSIWKQMYDERFSAMTKDMDKIIFPTFDELWIWESKRRMHYWLKANDIPHPKTWIFYNFEQSIELIDKIELPVVYKTNMGSGASGVIIFRKKALLKNHVKQCFKKGFTTYRRGPHDKEYGSIFLQEYIPDAKEWRIIRIGNSYFGYEKEKVGDFHSGSHRSHHSQPPSKLLDFSKSITNKGKFLSMDLDIFITSNGRYLVNELQPIFGMEHTSEMCVVDGRPGRMLFDNKNNAWKFEAGNFCQNNLCNLRVMTLLQILERKKCRTIQ